MLGVHALIGVGEAVITVAAVSAVLATRPDLVALAVRPPSAPPAPAAAGGAEPCAHPTRLFVVVALALAVGLATAVSPFASSSPDGLEQVAERQGLLDEGKLHAVQDDSPIPDYAFPGIDDERVATGSPGFVGTLGVFALGSGVGATLLRAAPATRHRRALQPLRSTLTGLAGDPASPVHRLDPRAKIARAGRRHARRGLHAAARVAGVCRLRAPCSRGRRGRARVPALDVWRRARVVLPLRAVRRGLRAVRAHGRRDAYELGPLTVHDAGLAVLARGRGEGGDRHARRGAARGHDHVPGRAARRSRRCACRACSS